MKAIVSVFAKDAKGITAYVTALLAGQEINILDISQTLMQEYFAMIMLVDLADCPLPFDELARWLKEKGEEFCDVPEPEFLMDQIRKTMNLSKR